LSGSAIASQETCIKDSPPGTNPSMLWWLWVVCVNRTSIF